MPTAYPSRRVWLHLKVTNGNGNVIFESGAVNPDGSITGNDNDRDASAFEPHYSIITREDQVQIYEPIMIASNGEVTTGLIYGVNYIKDNRLLPRGFDKNSAPHDVAVQGAAINDTDFIAGGDRITYAISEAASGTYTISAELNFQSIGYRWASNLSNYDSVETNRFVSLYQDNATDSSVSLATAEFSLQK